MMMMADVVMILLTSVRDLVFILMMMMADLALILLTSVRDKYVDELSTYYAIGVGKLESFEVDIFVLSRFL